MNAIAKIKKARTSLILDHPFFGALCLKFKIQEDNSFDTIWIDGETIGYNTKFIEDLNPMELKGVIAHEIMHIVLLHHLRRKNRNKKRWNKAGDYAINLILLNSGFTLPSDGLIDRQYLNMSVEEIYPLLEKEKEDKQKQKQNSQGNNQKEKKDKDKNKEEKSNSCGEVRDFKKINSQADVTMEEQNLKITIKQTLSQAIKAGKLPGDLKRLIKEIIKPKVNWKEILINFIQETAKDDFTWSRPNRRFIHQGIYLPSLKSNEIRPIALAVDTSGSIDKKLFNSFISELSSILEHYKFDINIIFCDTKVNKVKQVSYYDLPLKLEVKAGGGTNFKPPFKWIEENGIDIACLIYFTDLECHEFPEEPHYPVLWAKYGKYNNKVPFGDIIQIENI